MNKRKLILMLFAFVLMLGIFPLYAKAQETAVPLETATATYVNPMYADVVDESDLVSQHGYATLADGSITYCESVEEAGVQLRAALKARQETVTVYLISDTSDVQLLYDVFLAACEHTGVPDEGDYILYHCGGYNASRDGFGYGGTYYLNMTYTFTYYTTAQQEAEVDAAVDALLEEMNLTGKSDYEKVKTIYDWLCGNVTYDYTGTSSIKYTAYAAIINQNAVCQGYSNLFYRLTLELGIDGRLIAGNNTSHSWNIVKIGDVYYNLDATWDAGYVGYYSYFLRNMDNFAGHTRDADYSTTDFMTAYPMSDVDYTEKTTQSSGTEDKEEDSKEDNSEEDDSEEDDDKIEPADIAIPEKPNPIVNVVSGAKITWTAVDGISKYGVWRSETGINGSYKWLGNPTTNYFTDVNVESGKTYYYKITAILDGVHSERSEARGVVFVNTPDITSRVNSAYGIKIGWNKIEGATGYAIYRKPYESDTWVRVATVSGNETFTWLDTSVKSNNGTVYKYTIRALADSNMSTLSGCRGAGRTMVRLCSRVLNSATKTSATSIKCSWTTSAAVTGYEVRFMIGDEVYNIYTIGNYKTGVKTFTDLYPGVTYKVQVRSYKKVDGVGSFYSAWSTAKYVSL